MSCPDSVATRHYYDREFASPAVKLLPGEYFVTDEPIVLTTVLGSCVAACVRDVGAGLGGMNHFMLPDEGDARQGTSAAMRYGAFAMEMLLNELIKAGARRERLEAKVFGGGAVLAQMTCLNIGERNADFVLRYLQLEQVRVVAQDLCGGLPRRVNYFPQSGRATVRKLCQAQDRLAVQHEEQALARSLSRPRERSRLELFSAPPRTAGAAQPGWML